MENIVTIDLWSDNWKGEEIINILHDVGIRTAGMHTAINGTFEESVEWERCKAKELASICVSLKGDAMKSIAENVHSIEEVEEKPLFLYKVNIIDDVPDTDNKEEEDTEEEEIVRGSRVMFTGYYSRTTSKQMTRWLEEFGELTPLTDYEERERKEVRRSAFHYGYGW